MNRVVSEMKPKVSIIIPVFNVEKYLRQCLDSVVHQTLTDIEIILVDDGSTDESGHICDEYSEHDTRIRVIHKQNEGLSSARNVGIDKSNAIYILFVDSDDWVEPEFCEKPYRKAIENNADLVLFSFRIIRRDGTMFQKELGIHEGILKEEEAIQYNVGFAHAAWLGLYRRDLFEHVRYPVGKLYEEASTTHRLIHAAQRVFLINEPLYNYRVGRPGSITTKLDTRNHPDLREMLIVKINDLCSWGYEAYALPIAISLMAKYGCGSPEQQQMVHMVRNMKDTVTADLNWRQKAMFTILKISPTLYDIIAVVTGRRKI